MKECSSSSRIAPSSEEQAANKGQMIHYVNLTWLPKVAELGESRGCALCGASPAVISAPQLW